jgi:hypothetical protein
VLDIARHSICMMRPLKHTARRHERSVSWVK